MFRADGNFMYGVGDFSAASMADLGRVSRAHGYDPAAILRHVVGEPLGERATVPPAILHRIANPAQVFDRDHSIVVNM